MNYSTAQREVTIVSRDASRFSRDASRFSRDESRFSRDASRFSRDASRFSRGESRFSRVHCRYRPKAWSSGVFELLCLLARKTVVRLSFMNDVHIFFILKRPSKKFFFTVVEVKRDCKA